MFPRIFCCSLYQFGVFLLFRWNLFLFNIGANKMTAFLNLLKLSSGRSWKTKVIYIYFNLINIIHFYLKNTGINILLNYCTFCILFCCWIFFFFCFKLFFWTFNIVDLQGKMTVLCISFTWIIFHYLKNTGVSFFITLLHLYIFVLLLLFFCFAVLKP